MCGGFTCSKNALIALNILYIIVSFFLVGVATHWEASGIITSIPIIGGIIACGVFLLIISILGLIAAIRHHQVLLFFYMVVLFLLFVIQFGVACACLTVSEATELSIAKQGWKHVLNDSRTEVQEAFGCCGFVVQNTSDSDNLTIGLLGHPACDEIPGCCSAEVIKLGTCCDENSILPGDCQCPTCSEKLHNNINTAFRVVGGIGLFFSFTELAGAILAFRFRNLPYDTAPQRLPTMPIIKN